MKLTFTITFDKPSGKPTKLNRKQQRRRLAVEQAHGRNPVCRGCGRVSVIGTPTRYPNNTATATDGDRVVCWSCDAGADR